MLVAQLPPYYIYIIGFAKNSYKVGMRIPADLFLNYESAARKLCLEFSGGTLFLLFHISSLMQFFLSFSQAMQHAHEFKEHRYAEMYYNASPQVVRTIGKYAEHIAAYH